MATGIRIEGAKELRRKLAGIQELDEKAVLRAIGLDIIDAVSPYPNKTVANSPENPSGRWYERGYGPRWRRKRTGGVGGRRTSENLSKKWGIVVRGSQVQIGNTASYAEYVQGEKQAGFHASRGWKKLQDVAEQRLPEVVDALRKQIDRIWRS